MDKRFYDICYEILSQYQNFPDVADTYKSIKDGIDYRDNYPQTMIDFYNKKDDRSYPSHLPLSFCFLSFSDVRYDVPDLLLCDVPLPGSAPRSWYGSRTYSCDGSHLLSPYHRTGTIPDKHNTYLQTNDVHVLQKRWRYLLKHYMCYNLSDQKCSPLRS